MSDAIKIPRVPPPMAMLAELTHRCPLACPYCSNPTELTGADEELSTAEWISVFRQAAALGVLMGQDGLEPLMTKAVAAATRRGRELAG